MAANSFNLGDLLKLQNTNAAFQAAKYGGGASGGNSKLGGLLNILSGAYQAAFPNAPAANLIAGGVHARNLYKYNQALQAQQQAALLAEQQKNANDAAIYNKATGVQIEGDFNRDFANNMSGAIRSNQANPALANYIDTGEIDTSQMPATGDYSSGAMGEVLKNTMNRANAGNDAQATLDQLPKFMMPPIPNQGTGAPQGQPQGGMINMLPNGPQLELDPSQGPLQGNVAQNMPAFTMANAGTQGIPDVSQLLTGRKNEQGDRLGNRNATETERSNKANEKSDALRAQAAMVAARRPVGGGSNNPYTIPNAQQNYIQGQVNAIDNELKTLGVVGKNGEIIVPEIKKDGFLSKGSTPAEIQKITRANELLQARQQLQVQLGLPQSGSPAFRGQSKAKLETQAPTGPPKANTNSGSPLGLW